MKSEQDQDLRQEHDHRADAGDARRRRAAIAQHAVGQRRRSPPRAASRSPPSIQPTALRTRRTPPGTSRTAARAGSAGRATGCSSDRVEPVACSARAGAFADDRARRRCARARRWRSAMSCSARRRPRPRRARAERVGRAPRCSSSSPRLRTATVGDHRHAELARRAPRGSSSSPSRSARSTMLSATTIGRPSAISCSAKRR